MYIERIKYRAEEDGEMFTGYYVGAGENCDNSTILDKNYKPYQGEIWDYYKDYENRICLSIDEKEDFEEQKGD